MTCLSKEYETKAKMVQTQWLQLKVTFLLGYILKIVIYWGELTFCGEEIKFWWLGRESNGRKIFQVDVGGKWIFGCWRGTPLPHPPSIENPAHLKLFDSSVSFLCFAVAEWISMVPRGIFKCCFIMYIRCLSCLHIAFWVEIQFITEFIGGKKRLKSG